MTTSFSHTSPSAVKHSPKGFRPYSKRHAIYSNRMSQASRKLARLERDLEIDAMHRAGIPVRLIVERINVMFPDVTIGVRRCYAIIKEGFDTQKRLMASVKRGIKARSTEWYVRLKSKAVDHISKIKRQGPGSLSCSHGDIDVSRYHDTSVLGSTIVEEKVKCTTQQDFAINKCDCKAWTRGRPYRLCPMCGRPSNEALQNRHDEWLPY